MSGSGIELIVDGASHGGWKSAEIDVSIERVAGTFSVTATREWAENGRVARRNFAPGQAVQVTLDGRKAIEGFIDACAPQYNAASHTVRISGRDRAGDLVDCAAIHPGGEWLDAKLDRIAADLVKPYGVPVTVPDPGLPFERFAIEPGESVYEALERAARQRQVLIVSDGRGGIVVGRPAQGPDLGTLDRRAVLSASGEFSDANRFSEISVRANREARIEDVDPEDLAFVEGRARDPEIRRYRPKIVIAENSGPKITLAQRAVWEARVRAGRGRRAELTVDTWKAPSGALWTPNGRLAYSDDWLGAQGDFVVASVKFSQTDSARTAAISLLPPYAFDVLVPKGEEDDIGWGREKRDPSQRAAFQQPGLDRGARR